MRDKYDKGRYQEKKRDTYICVQIITSRPSPHDARIRIHTRAKTAYSVQRNGIKDWAKVKKKKKKGGGGRGFQ
jgi:hypothetical protein